MTGYQIGVTLLISTPIYLIIFLIVLFLLAVGAVADKVDRAKDVIFFWT